MYGHINKHINPLENKTRTQDFKTQRELLITWRTQRPTRRARWQYWEANMSVYTPCMQKVYK
jgi:hypothetical protein